MAASLFWFDRRRTGPLNAESKPPENAGLIDQDLVTAGADRNAQAHRRLNNAVSSRAFAEKGLLRINQMVAFQPLAVGAPLNQRFLSKTADVLISKSHAARKKQRISY